jgi:hypothetical protein
MSETPATRFPRQQTGSGLTVIAPASAVGHTVGVVAILSRRIGRLRIEIASDATKPSAHDDTFEHFSHVAQGK